MTLVIIRKGGELYEKTWNPDSQDYDISLVTDPSISASHLLSDVEIEMGVTLHDIFLLCDQMRGILGILLMRDFFNEYMDEWDRCKNTTAEDSDIQALYLSSYLEILDGELNANRRLNAVSGLTKNATIHDDGTFTANGDTVFYGIDLSELSTLLPLPVIISRTVQIDRHDGGTYENEKLTMSDSASYCLLDVLHALFWELSFYGSPEKTRDMREDMMGRFDEVRKMIEDGTIDDHTTSLDDFLSERE